MFPKTNLKNNLKMKSRTQKKAVTIQFVTHSMIQIKIMKMKMIQNKMM